MTTVRPLEPRDVGVVVERISSRLTKDGELCALVNPIISTELLADALRAATGATWVAEREGRVVGHLYGALLESESHGHGAWIGPDGASFDDTDVLADLYSRAGSSWIDNGALEHYVWTIDDPSTTRSWHELGFARMHLRGVLALGGERARDLPDGYTIRRGGARDLDLAVRLDHELDEDQRRGPSFSIGRDQSSKRDELDETLADPEVHHYVVEIAGEGVAQCITFPLPARRGSFDETLHLSAVTVERHHRGRGVASAMVERALNDGLDAGFAYVETNWRVTNRAAQRFWLDYGFTPTYVRLHRTIGAG